MEKSFSEKVAEAKTKVSSVTAEEANECLKLDPNTLFIDPRNETDIRKTTGIIPGALNLSLSELSGSADEELPQELALRDRTIITACQAGPMGALAAYVLKQRGFTNVHYIEGGTQGWLDAGFTTA